MRQLLRAGARLFWRPSVDDQVDDELAAHLELLVRRLERDGLSPDDARAAALCRFGDLASVRGLFAATALLLAAIGLYGVMAYLVTQRQAEIGIRSALGGGPGHVARLVIGDGMRMTIAGIALGVVVSLALGRVLDGLLYGIEPTDPVTYAVIAATLAIVALAASALPARRATKADPASALRA